MFCKLCLALLIFLPGLPLSAQTAPPAPLSLVKSIPLEGVEGRIDHMAIDASAGRFYVAALGNNTVEVIDLNAGKDTGRISGLEEPQGIRVLPESGALVVASGSDGKCRFYDRNQKLLSVIPDLPDADNVRLEPDSKLVYVGYGDGALAVIDPTRRAKIADIKLAGHPESFQLETKGKRIFVNVPTARQVAVIDREKRQVIATWPVKEAGGNFPMALDEANHRLFIGCRKPAKMLVLDTDSGKIVAGIAIVGDTDDLFYDAARKQLYATGGEGAISVIGQTDANTYKALGKVPSAPGARTSFYVPETGALYVAVPHRGEQKTQIQVFAASAGL